MTYTTTINETNIGFYTNNPKYFYVVFFETNGYKQNISYAQNANRRATHVYFNTYEGAVAFAMNSRAIAPSGHNKGLSVNQNATISVYACVRKGEVLGRLWQRKSC